MIELNPYTGLPVYSYQKFQVFESSLYPVPYDAYEVAARNDAGMPTQTIYYTINPLYSGSFDAITGSMSTYSASASIFTKVFTQYMTTSGSSIQTIHVLRNV